MKAKLLAGLMLLAVAIIGLMMATPNEIRGKAKEKINAGVSPDKVSPAITRRREDLPGTIDGAKNPDLIPDKVAYSTLFRFLSNRQSKAEKYSVRSYLKQRLCRNCSDDAELDASTDKLIDELLVAAEQFNRQVASLDTQAKTIKDLHWPNPGAEVLSLLTKLQEQKEALVVETAASLHLRLGAKGKGKMKQFVHDNFKRKIKITPGPQSPPGGPGWREMTGHH